MTFAVDWALKTNYLSIYLLLLLLFLLPRREHGISDVAIDWALSTKGIQRNRAMYITYIIIIIIIIIV